MIVFSSDIKVELVKVCADDLDVVNAARVSHDQESSWEEGWVTSEAGPNWENQLKLDDAKLVNYLMKNKHGSPFEHAFFKFRIEAPIFVFREWHRHRVGHSYNEMSGRYTQLEAKFYLPEVVRRQEGKPGAYTYVDDPQMNDLLKDLKQSYISAWSQYMYLLENGVAKEQARLCLPVAIYSKQIWSCNPRSLMHFLNLRTAPAAMKEIRMAASWVEESFAAHMPVTYAAWVANGRVAP